MASDSPQVTQELPAHHVRGETFSWSGEQEEI